MKPLRSLPWRLGALLAIAALAVGSAGAAGPFVREAPLPSPETLGPEVPATWPVEASRPEYNVGDPITLWVFVHVGTPHFEQRAFHIRGKTAYNYVAVEDAQWNVTMNQADVDMIDTRWSVSSPGPTPDLGIYEIDSNNFGPPPDMMDGDPRIFLVWFAFGNQTDGFFFNFDEYPDGTYPGMRSNERECVYLNTSNGQDPGGEYMIAVSAHEFTHMVEWYYDNNEDTWVSEGIAELAMWLYGHPDQISAFNTNADNSLTYWGSNWADYIKTYLWSLYFYERYGNQPGIYAVVHQPLNGIAGWDAALDQLGYTANVSDVFADWAVANFLDDTSIGDGRFGYVGETLPAFLVMGTHTTYPVPDQVKTVSHWGTDYYRFNNLPAAGLHIEFDGSNDNRFAVWGLGISAVGPTHVVRMTLDPTTQVGTLDMPGPENAGDSVVLVVAGVSNTGATSYIYRASESPQGIADGAAPSPLRLAAAPNPARGEVRLAWSGPARADARVELFDASGRLVRTLAAPASDGAASLAWDGRDSQGRAALPGIYYARTATAGAVAETRLVLLP